MKASTHMIRRMAATLFAAAAAAVAVPAAYAGFDGPPDAIDRYLAHQAALAGVSGLGGSPDAIDRYVGRTPVTVTAPTSAGFNWGDFGIGAAAMLGLVLLLAGLWTGAQVARHKGGQPRTS